KEGSVPVRVVEHRAQLLAIRRGEVSWPEVDAWRLELHRKFDAALKRSQLPERPDYARANEFLIKARRGSYARVSARSTLRCAFTRYLPNLSRYSTEFINPLTMDLASDGLALMTRSHAFVAVRLGSRRR
ncbi:MAG: hypothetical protein WKF30_02650, partial [Pyrinomonadaceae bacterium]